MTSAVHFQALAQHSSERLLNCAVEGMGIAALAWILLRAIGRQNSGTRFAVWFAALLAIAALPFLGYWTTGGGGLPRPSGITLPASWALYIFAGWTLIAAARLARLGFGLRSLRRLRKECPVDVGGLDPLLQRTLAEFSARRRVILCVSELLTVPTAVGFLRPMVVIPAWTMQQLPATKLNTILLHELAHLRRWDDWTNLVQRIVGAVLFFHPAIWWIESRLTLEREMACDDLVLAETRSPRAYAECLLALAEKGVLRRGIALAQAAVGHVRSLSARVSQILDSARPSVTSVWRPAPMLLTGLSLLALGVFSTAPQLISFDHAGGSFHSEPVPAALAAHELAAGGSVQSGAHSIPTRLEGRLDAKPGLSEVHTPAAIVPAAIVPAKLKVPPAKRPFNHMASAFPAPATEPMLVVVMETSLDGASFAADEFPAPHLIPAAWHDPLQILLQGAMGEQADANPRLLPSDPPVVWQVRVWQLTVITPSRTEQRIAAKSI